MKRNKSIKIVFSALFAALIFVGTQFIRVPLPFGYFNFGDCFVILSAIILGNPYAVFCSAIGSAGADVLSGYTLYAPATLVIKALMAIVAAAIAGIGKNKSNKIKMLFLCMGAFCAELIMVLGYFIYDIVLYGTAGALAALLGNVMQGAVALVMSVFLVTVFERTGFLKYFKSE